MQKDQQIWIKTRLLQKIKEANEEPEEHVPQVGFSSRRLMINSAKNLAAGRSLSNKKKSGDWGWNLCTVVADDVNGNGATVRVSNEEDWHACKDFASLTFELTPSLVKDGDFAQANVIHESDFDADGKPPLPPDDLITLTHLHEPAVVSSLRKRYDNNKIYTSTGPILLAINPFKRDKELYSDKTMHQYRSYGSAGSTSDLPPHVFAIADNTYRAMKRGLEDRSNMLKRPDQSILVSGESGAGKTGMYKN